MYKTLIIFFALISINMSLSAQIGGEHVYQFLDLDFNARSAALGGDFNVVNDNDINLVITNPASISNKLDKNVALNHAFFPAGISVGQLLLGKEFKKVGTFVGHLRYVNYGKFDRTGITGDDLGTFNAGDYALGIAYGKKLNERISIGGNANVIFSHYESYTSVGASVDFGAMYHDPENNITATILARNIGYQFKSYTSNNKEPLPVELLAGVSYKLAHAPFRFSLMGHDLTDWDLSYNDPTLQPTVDLSNDTIPVPSASFIEKTFRHLIIGVEILPSDNFSVRLGYNFDRRKTFNIEDRIVISGFSGGVGFKVKKIDINYSVSFYSPAGTINMLSVTSNFNSWIKKKN